jgi:DNA-binding transcriptional ArsR family regulator
VNQAKEGAGSRAGQGGGDPGEVRDLRLLKAFAHPLRMAILARLDEAVLSPKELAEELGSSLPVVSYHVRELERAGMIELVRTAPRRGALQHWYRARPLAALGDGEVAVVSARTVALDERGLGELAALLRDVGGRLEQIVQAAQARLADAGTQPLHATVSLMLFQSPYDGDHKPRRGRARPAPLRSA